METKDFKTWKELEKLNSAEKWKFISLVTVNGNVLVPYNNSNTSKEKKFQEIKKRFDSSLTPDGVYVFKARQVPGSKAVEDRIFVVKGDMSKMRKEFVRDMSDTAQTETTLRTREKVAPMQDNVLSWSEALKNVQEIADLKRDKQLSDEENKRLKARITELEADLQDDELEDDDEEREMPSWLNDVLPLVDKAADRFFKIKEAEIVQRDAVMRAYGITNGLPKIPGNGLSEPQVSETDLDKFLKYLDRLIDAGNMQQLQTELSILQRTNPTLHGQILQSLKEQGINLNEDDQSGD